MFQILNCSRKFKNQPGFVFIEILVAVALFSIVFIALLSIGMSVLNLSVSVKRQTSADFLAREELEAVRNFRDQTTWQTNGLGTVSTGESNPYYFQENSGSWVLVSGVQTTGIFTRQVVFENVSRDPSTQNIEAVYNASNDDSDTIKAVVTISWLDKTHQIISYFTNWKN